MYLCWIGGDGIVASFLESTLRRQMFTSNILVGWDVWPAELGVVDRYRSSRRGGWNSMDEGR